MGMTEWLLKPLEWLFAWRPAWRDAFGRLLLRLGNRFFIGLAVLFAGIGAWNQFGHPFEGQFAQQSFDWLMRHRPIAYRPDPQLVVLDIDEASLAAMSAQFGRWPWPRRVLADVAQQLEVSGAQAVVFDILFSDPDVANQDSEIAFDRYVVGSRKSYFPAVRLNPLNDGASQVTLSMLNFAQHDPAVPFGTADPHRTVAILTPYLKSIYDSTRMGTTNIYPDEDHAVRWYPSFEDLSGYRIPSLPYRVGKELHWPLPIHPRSLLNWPRGTTPYTTIGFAQAYAAVQRTDTTYFKQFAGKIVVIGSTATDFNDIRATPVDALYSGVYVLSTAIDNMKNGRFLRPLSAGWIWSLELLMLAACAQLFARTNQALTVAKYFFIVPAVLLIISLASVSFSDRLVDLSVPAAIVLGYFTIAKLFDANSRAFVSGTGLFAATEREMTGAVLQIACLAPYMTRDEVLDAVMQRRGEPIKVWEPEPAGFGREWQLQGWVLWRWYRIAGGGAAQRDGDVDDALRWFDVPVDGAAAPFVLAQRIAAAAAHLGAGPVEHLQQQQEVSC